MKIYQHILAAVEICDDDGPAVLRRAKAIADGCGASLAVVHVVEYLPIDPAGDALLATPVDLTQERRDLAQERIEQWCADEGIQPTRLCVNIGSITREILRVREEASADLIVIGHHSRRGLAALFSSTDDGVLSRAPCDVLAVHLS